MVLKTWKGTIAGFASTSLLSFATWKSYIKGIFAGFAADYNLYDGALILGFVLALFALFMIVKDMVDNGGFDKRETQKAMKTGLVMIGLLLGGYLVAKYWAASTELVAVNVDKNNEGDFTTTNGVCYTGNSQTKVEDIALSLGTQYVVIGGTNDTDYTMMYLYMNQSNFVWADLKVTRGVNLTISQDGISKVELIFYDKDEPSYNTLLSSADDPTHFDLTDEGTTTELNVTWSLADIMGWQSSNAFDNPLDKLEWVFTIGSDFDETEATTINWYWSTCGSDLSYLIVVGFWFLAGFIPFALQLNLFNKSTYSRKRGYRRKG